jgi:hypothetical protein
MVFFTQISTITYIWVQVEGTYAVYRAVQTATTQAKSTCVGLIDFQQAPVA